MPIIRHFLIFLIDENKIIQFPAKSRNLLKFRDYQEAKKQYVEIEERYAEAEVIEKMKLIHQQNNLGKVNFLLGIFPMYCPYLYDCKVYANDLLAKVGEPPFPDNFTRFPYSEIPSIQLMGDLLHNFYDFVSSKLTWA